MKKKLKVLLLFNSPYNKPRGYAYEEEFADPDNMYTENDVCQALLANNYQVSILGLYDSVEPLLEEIRENPDRKSTRLNSSHSAKSRMPSSA